MNAAGYEFWKRVDDLNPYSTCKELSEKIGLGYNTVKRQRSENRAQERTGWEYVQPVQTRREL